MYLQYRITSGKFAELTGVKRHIGDEIIGVAWGLKEQLRIANQRIAELEKELAHVVDMSCQAEITRSATSATKGQQ